LKAKKSYGQHFLNNPIITENIVEGLSYSGYENVLEVGPGKGVLTEFLIKKGIKLKVVEADRDMVNHLLYRFPNFAENIIQDDFLKVNITKIFDGKPFALIGNYPYNISSQILFKMVENRDLIPEMVGMFQKEVAKRVIAPPGSKVYGVISVLIQAYYEGTYLFDVNPENFDPPPKVMSGVIRLTRKNQISLGCDEKLFRAVVKSAFNQRRKMLRKTLKQFLPNVDLQKEIFFTKRPEMLSVEEFVKLTNWISENKSKE